jgi:putative SOS response-associated peptidase YedK
MAAGIPMCGRYQLMLTWAELHRLMELTTPPPEEFAQSDNVAPTQRAPIVRAAADGRREGALLRWGLVPSWSKDAKGASRMINARSETAAEKPAFRAAMRRRRCLVVATGFYEWETRGGAKLPWRIGLRAGAPFAMAGLWEAWKAPEGPPLETFAILTTSANELVLPLHDRMPVILPAEAWDAWLDPVHPDPLALRALLAPFPAEAMERQPASPSINRAGGDRREEA